MLNRFRRLIQSIFDYTKEKKSLSSLKPSERKLITRIREKNLTYLSDRKLASIVTSCRSIEASDLQGAFLEAGCALGGSSILIASLKDKERPLLVYDVFGMIPPPTEQDSPEVHARYRAIVEGESKGIGGNKYYGYEANLFDIVRSNLKSFAIDCDEQSVSLIKGLVQNTMNIDRPIAFAHVDVDWYDPVMTCLEKIFPNLVSGGVIILDDYHDWGGCRKATDEYLQKVAGQFYLDDSAGSMKIIKR
jgi:hypothetical protein